MPFAKSVSVKTFEFDEDGNEPEMDYPTLFDIIHAAGYTGWLGIEYEGDDLPSREGIEKNLVLAKKSWIRRPVIDAAARARLDATLSALVKPGGVVGISALVFEKGEEVYFRAAGDADREAKVPMDRNTLVQIYSMTKPFTGVALMQVYEQAKFDMDDPVEKYIPELANMTVYDGVNGNGKVKAVPAKRAMTIRDLTRHTAGFYNGGDTPALKTLWQAAGVRQRDHTLTQLAEKMATYPLLFHPGEQWNYGPCVDMQALVV
jgi:CubicO group peptidase (beta-lactamase class C family)